jgi:hypothetical protein
MSLSKRFSYELNITSGDLKVSSGGISAGNVKFNSLNITGGTINNFSLSNFTAGNVVTNNVHVGVSSMFSGSATALNNTTGAVTGLTFDNATVRCFTATVSVNITTTNNTDLFETFTLEGTQTLAGWQLAVTSYGDNSGFDFSIDSNGQVSYTSSNLSFVSNITLRFNATQISKTGSFAAASSGTQGSFSVNSIELLTTTDANGGAFGALTVRGGATIQKNLNALSVSTGNLVVTNTITSANLRVSNSVLSNVTVNNLFQSNGSLQIYGDTHTIGSIIVSGGNIAIGSTNPNQKLKLNGPVGSVNDGPHIQVTLDNSNYPLFHQLNWSRDNIAMVFDGYYEGGTWRTSSTSASYKIYKYNERFQLSVANGTAGSDVGMYTPALTIVSSGNIGIGTDTPASWAKLDIGGRLRTTGHITTNNTNGVTSVISPENGGFLTIEAYTTGNTSKLPVALNPFGGYVGIGTTGPQTKLHVYDQANGANAGIKIEVNHTGSSTYSFLNFSSGDAFGANIFLNSRSRSDDGGVNTWTIRNDTGAVRIQSAGGWNTTRGLWIHSTTGNLSVGTTNVGTYTTPLNVRHTSTAAGAFWQIGPDGSNNLILYDQNNTGQYMLTGGTTWYQYSDSRLKKNINSIQNSLDKVSQLNPVNFHYNSDDDTAPLRVGFIAQEVQQLFPEIVSVTSNQDYSDVLGLSQTEMIPYIVKAVKELKQENDQLKAQNEQLLAFLQSKFPGEI